MIDIAQTAASLAASSSIERVELAKKVSRFLSIEHEDEDISPITDLAVMLVEDVSRSVRETLAHGLVHAAHMPDEVAKAIAQDEISISGAFFAETTAFDDARLASLISELSNELQMVIAARPDIGQKTVGSIAFHGSKSSAEILLKNQKAIFSEKAASALIERFPREKMLMELMAMRAQMPLSILSELVELVSSGVRERLEERIGDESAANEVAALTRYESIWNQMAGARGDRVHAFALDLKAKGRLEHGLVIYMWGRGARLFTESALSLMTGASRSLFRDLMEGADPKTFSRLLKEADVTREQFTSYMALLEAEGNR